MGAINTEEAARRLARVILSDIELYSRERPQEGESLEAQIEEGRRLFGSRVTPALAPLFAVVLADRQSGGGQTPEMIAAPPAAKASMTQASLDDHRTPGPRIAARAMEDQPTPGPVVSASVLNSKVTTTRPIRRVAARALGASPKPPQASTPASVVMPVTPAPVARVPVAEKSPSMHVPAASPPPVVVPASAIVAALALTASVHYTPSNHDIAVPVLTSRFSIPKLVLTLAAVAGIVAFLLHFAR